jgi:hypothetical protein
MIDRTELDYAKLLGNARTVPPLVHPDGAESAD